MSRSFNPVFASLGTTIFETMSLLAREHQAVNLGQGFPEGEEPKELLKAAAKAMTEGWQQYPPMVGLPELRQAIARHEARHYGLEVDWQNEILVTSGATEALASSLFALVEAGDEVIVFEPLYDAYIPLIRQAGATPRVVGLRPPEWRLTREALEAAVSPRTKAILINTPMNPTGKVFSAEEIDILAAVAEAQNLYVISDEVYEHLTFGNAVHRGLRQHPGLAGRTLRIGSFGKIFSVTGWKVGFIVAETGLLDPVKRAHQFLVFTTPPGLQEAVAWALDNLQDYGPALRERLKGRRDLLSGLLTEKGYRVLPSDSTYFLNIDLTDSAQEGKDQAFCENLIREHGVAAIPVSAFCPSGEVTSLVRFCFAKPEAQLREAANRMPGL